MNSKIVLIRHGESVWNLQNRFTGWTDVDLSENGINEAYLAAKLLKENDFAFDLAYTSYLKRAVKTLWLVLDSIDHHWIPVRKSWKLNERHYGGLQGLNKKETAEKHGDDQVHQWRRGYSTRPPALDNSDERHPCHEAKYAELGKNELPNTESLEDTVSRVIPYWENEIVPQLKAGKKIIISAHGNSLRALVKHLENISDEEIPSLNIPTGKPFIFEFDQNAKAQKWDHLGE